MAEAHEKLKAENQALKQNNARLESEKKHLEKDNSDLRAQLDAALKRVCLFILMNVSETYSC